MIQAMFDENARKYRVHVDGSKEDIIKNLLEILQEVYQSKTLKKEELIACVEAATMEKEQIVKELVDRMPLVMTAAVMGNKEAQNLVDRFFDLFKQDKDE